MASLKEYFHFIVTPTDSMLLFSRNQEETSKKQKSRLKGMFTERIHKRHRGKVAFLRFFSNFVALAKARKMFEIA